MPIGVCLVTKNVHEHNNPALYDQGRVMLPASAEKPAIDISIPVYFLRDSGLSSADELEVYQPVNKYLQRETHYTAEDAACYFGQGAVHYYVHPNSLYLWHWLMGLLSVPRRYVALSFSPDLFMIMAKARGIPSVTGNEAIQLVSWLRETFSDSQAGRRDVQPKFASVEVKSKGVSSSVIEITVDKAYAGLLIGKGCVTIKAIRAGIAAMYGHSVAIVTVKTV